MTSIHIPAAVDLNPPATASAEAVGAMLDGLAPALVGKPAVSFGALKDIASANGVAVGAQAAVLRRVLNARILTGQIQRLPGNLYRWASATAPRVSPIDSPDSVAFMEGLAAHPDAETSLLHPAVDPSFRYTPGLADYLRGIAASAQGGTIEHLRFVGPAGCGKTEAGLQVAAMAGYPAFIMDASVVREPRDWFGSRTVRGGSVAWQDSPFTHAIQRGRCVVILDEVNRASLAVANSLLPLLDRRRSTLISERGEPVRVGAGTIIVATMNEGAQFTGTSPLDAALRDRFPRVVEFDYLAPAEEASLLVARTGIDAENADRLVAIASKTRKTHGGTGIQQFGTAISTRQLLAAADDLKRSGPSSLA
ncbi:MAG: AAA family ATPase, partial [Planctomycetes bacterium]|nr:AAA family ATPase [Planctomycetota bacterium]